MADAERANTDRLIHLAGKLDPEDVGELVHLAEYLTKKKDPVAYALENAPGDDEPLTAEEIDEIKAAKAEKGFVTLEALEKELGL